MGLFLPWENTQSPEESWPAPCAAISLPLDRGGRLAGDVVADAVRAFDFVDDAGRDFGEEFVREAHPVGSHAVMAAHHSERMCLACERMSFDVRQA